MKRTYLTALLLVSLSVPAFCHEGMGMHDESKEQMVTVKGEVLDMACYMDHAAQGPKHASCAKKCILSGLPVGIKGEDGKTYLLIGEHKPMNKQLAEYAGKTISVKGKLASRDGINLLENAEIQK